MNSSNPYFVVFYNSVQSHLAVSPVSDSAWLAAITFGTVDTKLVTLVAFAGSMLGMLINYGICFYVTRWRDELPSFNEKKYQKVCRFVSERMFVLLFLPSWPFLEFLTNWFVTKFVCLCGLFRMPLLQIVTVLAVSRILFYGYYLVP